MFWSDLGPEVGFEGIGLVDPSLPTVAVFAKPSKVQRTTSNLDESARSKQEVNKEVLPSEKSAEESKEQKPKEVKEIEDHKWPAIEEEQEPTPDYGKGVIFYLKNDKIVGIVLWNLFNRIGLARTIINQNKTYDDLNEVAKLFAIHS